MEANPNAKVNSTRSFLNGTDNGALFPGKLDLHLTSDGYSLLMGNSDVEFEGTNFPYLIEVYNTVQGRCRSEEFEITRNTYKFPSREATHEEFDARSARLNVLSAPLDLSQEHVCPKRSDTTPP